MANIFQKFGALLNFKRGATTDFNKALYRWLGNSVIWSQDDDRAYIKDGFQKNAVIYAIINKIYEAAITVPVSVYEIKDKMRAKDYEGITRGSFDDNVLVKSELLKKRAFTKLADHPLQHLLKYPNSRETFSDLLTQYIGFGEITGNRYIYGMGPMTGNNKNKFTELHIMPSQSVEILSGGTMQPIRAYRILYGGEFEAPEHQVLHIKNFNPDFKGTGSYLYGQSPLRAGMRQLKINNLSVETGAKFLQNQTARGVLSSDGGMSSISQDQAEQLKESFKSQFNNQEKWGEIVVTPAKLEWTSFGLPLADLALLEQKDASTKDLCNIYGVPIQLMNSTEASTFNNQKEARKALFQNTVIPKLIRLREGLNRWLAPGYGDNLFIDFDFSSISELQEDAEKISKKLSTSWWLTPNEKRVAMNYAMSDDPQMDEYYMPANLLPLNMSDTWNGFQVGGGTGPGVEEENSTDSPKDSPKKAPKDMTRTPPKATAGSGAKAKPKAKPKTKP